MSATPAPFDDLYEASPGPSQSRNTRTANSGPSMSPSPAASTSSDKENRASRPAVDKGNGKAMNPPNMPASNSAKRKRIIESDASPDRNRRRRTVELDENADGSEDMENYDPDQDIEERRKLRKGLRDLSKTLSENRSEYLAPASTGIRDILLKANDFSGQVKQTSDATIDSRLLVNTAELSYKKTLALISGDTSQGVDIEDFISKCTQYMRNGEEEGPQASQEPSSTQRRRRRDDEEVEEDGDMLNWEYLGRHACIPSISRPSVPGFLLGPLSLEKRVRKVVVRQAKLKLSTLEETRPEVLKAGDIEKSENETLTTLCLQILTRLKKVRLDAMKGVEEEQDRLEKELGRGLSNKEAAKVIDRHNLSEELGIAFFNFVINPRSFGQSVENMFYTSFLIRDGKLGINFDDQGMPFLGKLSSIDNPCKTLIRDSRNTDQKSWRKGRT